VHILVDVITFTLLAYSMDALQLLEKMQDAIDRMCCTFFQIGCTFVVGPNENFVNLGRKLCDRGRANT
jgi:hypothetical protein